MNICLTVNSSPWSFFKGGGQIAVHYLAKHLVKNNCKVWVIYTGKRTELGPSSLNYTAIFARHFDIKTLNLNIFSVAFEVFKLNKKVHLDIIHGNGEEAFFFPYLRKLTNSEFILTSHSPFMPQTGILLAMKNLLQMLKRLNFYLLRTAAIHSDKIITYSNFSKKLVKNGIGTKFKSKVETIAPGIDSSWFKLNMSNKVNLQNLLYFGRIEHEKGIDILIKAFANLLIEFPFLNLHIVGDGNYKSFSHKICKELGAENNIIFYGWKEKNEIQKIMSRCDLCLLPSRIESFGLTIVEAMAGGIPVISTKAGAIPEIIDDRETGILVPPEDIRALINAISFALKNTGEMQRMAKSARKKVKQLFSWDLTAKKHIEIYKSVLRNRKL